MLSRPGRSSYVVQTIKGRESMAHSLLSCYLD